MNAKGRLFILLFKFLLYSVTESGAGTQNLQSFGDCLNELLTV